MNAKNNVSSNRDWSNVRILILTCKCLLQEGNTPLVAAALIFGANVELVKLLIDNGADVNAKDKVRSKW